MRTGLAKVLAPDRSLLAAATTPGATARECARSAFVTFGMV